MAGVGWGGRAGRGGGGWAVVCGPPLPLTTPPIPPPRSPNDQGEATGSGASSPRLSPAGDGLVQGEGESNDDPHDHHDHHDSFHRRGVKRHRHAPPSPPSPAPRPRPSGHAHTSTAAKRDGGRLEARADGLAGAAAPAAFASHFAPSAPPPPPQPPTRPLPRCPSETPTRPTRTQTGRCTPAS